MNVAYSAYKGAQVIKEGDILGGALAIASTIPGVSTAAQVASAGVQAYRAAENGDYLGALASGLGGVAMTSGGQSSFNFFKQIRDERQTSVAIDVLRFWLFLKRRCFHKK